MLVSPAPLSCQTCIPVRVLPSLSRCELNHESLRLRSVGGVRAPRFMDTLSDDMLERIVQGLIPPNHSTPAKPVEGDVPVAVLKFAGCSIRCHQVAMSDAVGKRPYSWLAGAFGLDHHLWSLEHAAESLIPPYAGPALRRPHRSPWSADDAYHMAHGFFPLVDNGDRLHYNEDANIAAQRLSRFSDGQVQDRFFPSCEKALPPAQRSSLWVERRWTRARVRVIIRLSVGIRVTPSAPHSGSRPGGLELGLGL